MTAPVDARAEALAVLRELEWSGWQNTSDGRTLPCCPSCRILQYDWINSGSARVLKGGRHKVYCRLANTIAALEAEQAAGALDREAIRREAILRATFPIGMQDVRLFTGEGRLSPLDVIVGVNAVLRQRERHEIAVLAKAEQAAPDGGRG